MRQPFVPAEADGRFVHDSAILAALEQRLDFVVVAQERDEEVGRTVQEDEAQRQAGAAFEQLTAQLTDSKPTVDVGLAEDFG
jgi:hypothetical protein